MEQRNIELELRVKYLETHILYFRNVVEILKNELKKEMLEKLDMLNMAKSVDELTLIYSKATSTDGHVLSGK
jgi:hypothetical protein